jgi:hypothetical protein
MDRLGQAAARTDDIWVSLSYGHAGDLETQESKACGREGVSARG